MSDIISLDRKTFPMSEEIQSPSLGGDSAETDHLIPI